MIERMGFEALDFGVVPDVIGKIENTIDKAAADADMIISSGGASVGEADFIRQVLASRGEVLFWKVAMRPGRPLAYGKVGEVDFWVCRAIRYRLWFAFISLSPLRFGKKPDGAILLRRRCLLQLPRQKCVIQRANGVSTGKFANKRQRRIIGDAGCRPGFGNLIVNGKCRLFYRPARRIRRRGKGR